jgi:hypothetical protein
MRFYVTLFGLKTRPSQVSSRDPDSLLKGVVGPDLNRIGEGCEGRALALLPSLNPTMRDNLRYETRPKTKAEAEVAPVRQ